MPSHDDVPREILPVPDVPYASMLLYEHTDHNVGRLIDALEELGILDDTLVYVIIDVSPVKNEYKAGDNTFTGKIERVEPEAGQDSHDHLVDPEDVLRPATAKQ